MNENNVVTGNPLVSLLSGLSSGDKGFVLVLLSIVGAYAVKRYFDSADTAMEHGYNATVTSPKYGEMKFERNHEAESEQAQTGDNQSLNEEETNGDD